MIPIRLTLDGFLSYREEAVLDFNEIELACIIGQNGAGKSSLLDAITWALFGKARSNDDDLVNLAKTQALVIFEFLYEDQRYRIERLKKKNNPKSVLLNVWSPQDEIWVDFSDGTNRDTQDKIERILRMDYDTFINASFFLQGKADQFAQQKPAERKRTLAKILELDIWEDYRKQIADRRKALEGELDVINARLQDIQDVIKREPELLAELRRLQDELAQNEAMVTTQEKLVDGLRKVQQQIGNQKEQLRILEESHQRAIRRRETAHTALQETEQKQSHYQKLLANEAEVKIHYETWLQQQQELDQLDAVSLSFNAINQKREGPLQRLIAAESRLTSECNQLEQRAIEIQHRIEEKTDLEEKLTAALSEQAQIRKETSQYLVLEEEFDDLSEQRRKVEPDIVAIRNELQRLKDRKAKLEQLEAVECPTCGQPLTELHRREIVQGLKDTHAALREEYELKVANFDLLQQKMDSLDLQIRQLKEREERELVKRVNVMINSYEVKIQTWSDEITKWNETGKQQLDTLRSVLENKLFCEEERLQLSVLEKELEEMGYVPARHDALRQMVQAGRQYQHQFQELNEARGVLEQLSAVSQGQEQLLEEATQEVANSKAALDQAEKILTELESSTGDYATETRKLMQLRDEHNQIRQSVGGAEQRLHTLNEKRSFQETILEEREVLQTEINQHKVLEEAFGKNGVPALLIDQALPEIEIEANQILGRLSTNGMAVQIRTQEAYKDKNREDLKETLDIIISDDVGVRPYEMYSGGEAFRVNFAIRLALSKMLAARTGARLQTLVIDEGFGSQDADGLQRLVSTINAIKDDFAKIIVITHLETLKGSFPTQIEITKDSSGSQLQVVQA